MRHHLLLQHQGPLVGARCGTGILRMERKKEGPNSAMMASAEVGPPYLNKEAEAEGGDRPRLNNNNNHNSNNSNNNNSNNSSNMLPFLLRPQLPPSGGPGPLTKATG